MTSDADLSLLPDALREPVDRFAQRLEQLGGDQVLGLCVYGSTLRPNFDSLRDEIQSVLVLRWTDLGLLKRLAIEGRRHARDGLAAPLVMTPEFIQSSLDTFPLELLEIQQRGLTVLGPDYFGPLKFEPRDVRLQCERELKVLSLSLCRGMLTSAGQEHLLSRVEAAMAAGLLRIFRGLVWLKGGEPVQQPFQLVAAVEKLLGRTLAGVCQVLDDADAAHWQKLESLHADLTALSEQVNGL